MSSGRLVGPGPCPGGQSVPTPAISAPKPGPGAEGAEAALLALLDATRALLWLETAADAAAVARTLIAEFGGRTVPVRSSMRDALAVDVSFGASEPLLPAAPPGSNARMLLDRHIPAFVRDAQRALELRDLTSRLAEDAAVDSLTSLSNRRMLGRALGRVQPKNTVIMIDLDHLKALNDALGHHEGDRVLRAIGQALNSTVRASDRVGRYGGDEFVVILADDDADVFLQRLTDAWVRSRPHSISFSAGVAPAHPGPRRALQAADRAMYRAKRAGRDQWYWALAEDYL